MFFSNIYWPHLTGPFYWIHFETSIYQFNGSTFSIMPDEVREQIRDHSFIQNLSRSSDSQLLLFSSLTHLLQGSGQRTPDTRSETIPSSRITPDLQIHSFSSSVHLTHLLQDSGQRTPDTRSETIPSSRITPDLQIHIFFSSVHSSSAGFRSENTWHEIRDHSFIQNHSRSSDSQLLLFSSPHSSSTGFRSENTWHEIRDHSFIQNHSRSSDSQLLLFSSLIFYRIQIREHLTRDQRPFLHPESLQILQIHSFSSSVHSQGSGQRTGLVIAEAWFWAQWPIFVLFLRFVLWLLVGWKIQTWPIIRSLTESVT